MLRTLLRFMVMFLGEACKKLWGCYRKIPIWDFVPLNTKYCLYKIELKNSYINLCIKLSHQTLVLTLSFPTANKLEKFPTIRHYELSNSTFTIKTRLAQLENYWVPYDFENVFKRPVKTSSKQRGKRKAIYFTLFRWLFPNVFTLLNFGFQLGIRLANFCAKVIIIYLRFVKA